MGACCSTQAHFETKGAIDNGQPTSSIIWLKIGLALAVSGLTMSYSLGVNLSPPSGYSRWVIHGILAASVAFVFLLLAPPILRQARVRLKSGFLGIELLFLAGIFGAFFASLHSTLTQTGEIYYEVVAILLTIYSVGQAIGQIQKKNAFQALDQLKTNFSNGRLLSGETVSVDRINQGTVIHVLPGENIPVDGKIKNGTAFIDETSMTGEPFAKIKQPGDLVLAGSRNLDGNLHIKSSTEGCSRHLDALVKTLEQARLSRSNFQREADRIAQYFLPFVTLCSVSTFFIWWWIATWQEALFNALAVLIVSCPCALGLATPIAIWSCLNRLNSFGLVAQTSEFIERLAKVDTLILDKTGTLSELAPTLEEFSCINPNRSETLKAKISAAQRETRHPLADLFAQWEPSQDRPSVKLIPAQGIEAHFPDGSVLKIGNQRLLATEHYAQLKKQVTTHRETQNAQSVYVIENGELAAIAYYKETLRQGATKLIRRFKNAGFPIYVLTGDSKERLKRLNLEGVTVKAEMKPMEKKDFITSLQSRGKRVLYVGDGVNDGPAFTEAFAGIAMKEGSGIIHDTAHAVLKEESFRALIPCLNICRSTVATLKQNLWFAGLYNLIGIGLAMSGFLNPVYAALLMLAASATVSYRALSLAKAPFRNQIATPIKTNESIPKNLGWPGRQNLLMGASCLIQAPLIAYAGDFSVAGWLTCLVLFAYPSIAIVRNHNRWTQNTHILLMALLWGNIGMLLGWIAQTGFQPIVHEGICLCGCPDSPFGLGLIGFPTTMHLGMILGGMFGTLIALSRSQNSIFEKFESSRKQAGCLFWMCLSMWSASLGWSLIPIFQNAHGQFVLTLVVMFSSMTIPMLICLLRELDSRTGRSSRLKIRKISQNVFPM
ncbi:MAG: heavy metal translocating P-type ATPase [Verrucomicrobiota bacterium]